MFFCCDLFLSGSSVSQFDTISFKVDKEMPSSSLISVEVSSVVLPRLQCICDAVSHSSGMYEVVSI